MFTLEIWVCDKVSLNLHLLSRLLHENDDNELVSCSLLEYEFVTRSATICTSRLSTLDSRLLHENDDNELESCSLLEYECVTRSATICTSRLSTLDSFMRTMITS